MSSHRYNTIKEKISADPVSLAEAVDFLKKHSQTKFDETIEVHINLGIDPQKSDQMVRGQVTLPHGTPKQKKIVILTEEIINKIIADKNLDADIALATPALMPKVAKVAKILGPKGLMPNPKTGTVTADPDKTVKELSAGKISFKMDQLGNIHEPIAKVSWSTEKIIANAEELIKAVKSSRPATSRGQFLKKIVLTSTMSPALCLQTQAY